MARVLIIGGPTATGKTDLAIEIARSSGAAVVSADAMTVYRHLDVGTAKPSAALLARTPHACVDVRDPDEDFTVDDFFTEALRVCEANERVVVVGGTPFYLASLVRPLSPLPRADAEVRARLEALDDLHDRLRRCDPRSAARLHPNDRVRLVRALEVFELTGRPLSDWQDEPPRAPPLAATVCWLDRDDLRARIDLRLRWMQEGGYLEEIEAVLAAGFSRDCKPLRSFSYRHMIEALEGTLSVDEALRRTGRDTWRFARKQRTWGRGQRWEAVDASGVREVAARTFGLAR